MATLNIKNVPDALYKKLQRRAKQQHRTVAQEVIQLLREILVEPKVLSILKLQGLGKKEWTMADAATHVQRERDAWD